MLFDFSNLLVLLPLIAAVYCYSREVSNYETLVWPASPSIYKHSQSRLSTDDSPRLLTLISPKEQQKHVMQYRKYKGNLIKCTLLMKH